MASYMKEFTLTWGMDHAKPIGRISLTDEFLKLIEKDLPELTLVYTYIKKQENEIVGISLSFAPSLKRDTMGEEEKLVFYVHDSNCSGTNFTELNDRGLKTCLDCAGIFDADGKGIATQDKRFDENYTPPEV